MVKNTIKRIPYEIICPIFGIFAFFMNSNFNQDYDNYLYKFVSTSVENISLDSAEFGFQIITIEAKEIGMTFDVFLYHNGYINNFLHLKILKVGLKYQKEIYFKNKFLKILYRDILG